MVGSLVVPHWDRTRHYAGNTFEKEKISTKINYPVVLQMRSTKPSLQGRPNTAYQESSWKTEQDESK